MANSGSIYPSMAVSDDYGIGLNERAQIVIWGEDAPALNFPDNLYKTVSAAVDYALAITFEGEVVAAGTPYYNRDYDQATVPPGITSAVQVAAGVYHAAALLDDGTVVCWGRNDRGECDPPVGLTGVIKVAVVNGMTLALKSDGTLVAWGDWSNPVHTSLTGVIDIAAASREGLSYFYYSNFIVAQDDGSVVRWQPWGSYSYGVPGAQGAVSVECYYDRFMALLPDGTVYMSSSLYEPPEGLDDVVHIATGRHQSQALKSDGTMIMWRTSGGNYIVEEAEDKLLIPGEMGPISGALAATPGPYFDAFAENSPSGSMAVHIGLNMSGTGYLDWTANLSTTQLQQVYLCILTGAEDGLDDLSLQVSSWQATSQAGGRSSYLQVIVPASQGLLEAISDRSNGQIIIRKGYILPGGSTQSSEILRCSFETFRHDRGPRRFTLTMSGYRSGIVEKSGTRTLTGVRSISTTNGKRRVRADIDLFLQPGMTVQADNETFQAGHINYYATDRDEFCEVGEA
ncbi:RCC1 domain-containing protein [Marinobacter bryozoorum]|uniref:RCC1 domain-containing protein n=1 Tax=Marinobacter bryozoorum TaxID=256324 RepID=UPI00200572EA|nr:RCC1 domain-containing protein [Marinobacter bryozoorum]MCK7542976.1 RCC1 domain-containing protein [Marinobacter bryozoorum]